MEAADVVDSDDNDDDCDSDIVVSDSLLVTLLDRVKLDVRTGRDDDDVLTTTGSRTRFGLLIKLRLDVGIVGPVLNDNDRDTNDGRVLMTPSVSSCRSANGFACVGINDDDDDSDDSVDIDGVDDSSVTVDGCCRLNVVL